MKGFEYIEQLTPELLDNYLSGNLSVREASDIDFIRMEVPAVNQIIDNIKSDDNLEELAEIINSKIHQVHYKSAIQRLMVATGVAGVIGLTLWTVSLSKIEPVNMPLVTQLNFAVENPIEDFEFQEEDAELFSALEAPILLNSAATQPIFESRIKEVDKSAIDLNVQNEKNLESETISLTENIPTSIVKQVNLIGDAQPLKVRFEKNMAERTFKTAIDYKQTVELEEIYAIESPIVGRTKSYAPPIRGYKFDPFGMPSFGEPGDLEKYFSYTLTNNPTLKGNESRVNAKLSFVVNSKGKIKDVMIVQCGDPQVALAIQEAVENMPDWQAGSKKGKKGKLHIVMSIQK